jgi:pentatricopeptide repeat protein
MSEMLGNHYFQVRKYLLAEQVYEKLPSKELSNTIILKKLIICYTQTNKLEKALKLFLQLIENDLAVFGVEMNADDCPCNELIFSIESGETKYLNDFQRYTSLGILWMFCSCKTSLNYFKMTIDESPDNETVKKILQLIKNYFNQNNFNLN